MAEVFVDVPGDPDLYCLMRFRELVLHVTKVVHIAAKRAGLEIGLDPHPEKRFRDDFYDPDAPVYGYLEESPDDLEDPPDDENGRVEV